MSNLGILVFLFLLCNLINKPRIQNKYNCCLSVSYITLYTSIKRSDMAIQFYLQTSHTCLYSPAAERRPSHIG